MDMLLDICEKMDIHQNQVVNSVNWVNNVMNKAGLLVILSKQNLKYQSNSTTLAKPLGKMRLTGQANNKGCKVVRFFYCQKTLKEDTECQFRS